MELSMEPHRPHRGALNFVLWFVVIALAVCVGNLASGYIRLYVARERLSLYRQGSRQTTGPHLTQIKQQSETHAPQGRRLPAGCHDWQQALRGLDTPTVRDGVKRHCGAYEKYLKRVY